MQKYTPDFQVNVAYRSIRLSNLFSGRAKPLKRLHETTNCVYKFQCFCSSSYVGTTDRPLAVRIGEHFSPPKPEPMPNSNPGIFYHTESCDNYQKNLRLYFKNSKTPRSYDARKAAKFEFFKSNFSILQKNFRSYFERMDSEAYFIRVHKPDLNDQKEHVSFSLF